VNKHIFSEQRKSMWEIISRLIHFITCTIWYTCQFCNRYWYNHLSVCLSMQIQCLSLIKYDGNVTSLVNPKLVANYSK